MKQAVLFFRMKDSFVDLKKVNDTIDLLCGSHFSPTQITFLPCEDRKEFYDVFTALSETTDNILVFENENNDFELSEIVQGYDRLNYIYEKGKKSVLFVADNQKANSVVEDLWIPHLQKKYDTSYGKVTFKVFGLKRKEILAATGRIEKETGVGFVVYGEGLDYKVQLVYDNRSTKMDYDRAQKDFITGLKDYIYAEYDVELNERLVDLLKLRRCVLSVAEESPPPSLRCRAQARCFTTASYPTIRTRKTDCSGWIRRPWRNTNLFRRRSPAKWRRGYMRAARQISCCPLRASRDLSRTIPAFPSGFVSSGSDLTEKSGHIGSNLKARVPKLLKTVRKWHCF